MAKYLDDTGLAHLVSKLKESSGGGGSSDPFSVGELRTFAEGVNPGEKYLRCDGSQVLAEDYPALPRDISGFEKTRLPISNPFMLYANGKYVLMGKDGQCYTSVDAVTWSLVGNCGLETSETVQTFDFNIGYFFIGTSILNIKRSKDLVTWEVIPLSGALTYNYVLSSCVDESTNIIYWITSGGYVLSFTLSSSEVLVSKQVSSNSLRHIAAKQGVVLVVDSGSKMYRSYQDRYTFTEVTAPSTSIKQIMCAGKYFFAIIGDNLYLKSSEDGITWNSATDPYSLFKSKVLYSNGRYYVRNSSSLYYSFDGCYWKYCALIDYSLNEFLKTIIANNRMHIISGIYIYSSINNGNCSLPKIGTNTYIKTLA